MLCDKGLPCSVFSPLSSTAKFCSGKYAINRNQHCQELSFCGSKCLLQRSPCPKSILRPTIGQPWSTLVKHGQPCAFQWVVVHWSIINASLHFCQRKSLLDFYLISEVSSIPIQVTCDKTKSTINKKLWNKLCFLISCVEIGVSLLVLDHRRSHVGSIAF